MTKIRVKKIVQETPDTITLIFDLLNQVWHYEAGQFITLRLPIDGKKYYRSYSLATSPYHDPHPAITIKRVRGGKISNYLHDQVRVGSTLACSSPQGDFTIKYAPNQERHFVFIAGGSGIVPLYAMIKAVLYQEPRSKVTLIDSNRSQHDIIYKQPLDILQKQYSQRIQIHHILTQATANKPALQGRLNPQTLLSLIAGELKSKHYFLCAPQGLMDIVRSTLFIENVPSENIRQETFISPTAKQGKKVQTLQAKVTLYHRKKKYDFTINKGDTLLDAVLDHGIHIPFSCCNGTCNACRVKCTKGNVSMVEDGGLSQQEKEAGYVLTCVSYPKTNTLTLVLDD